MLFEEEIDVRLSSVEAALSQFIIQTGRSLHILQREMKEFKDEMKEFKDEMKDFKDEMKDFKDDSLRVRAEMNRQWGDLANKMGTIVEDIVSPAVRPVMSKFFNEEVTYITINTKKKDKNLNLQGEFDVIAASNTRVFLVETKSNPKKEQIIEFKTTVIPRFRQLFPEFEALQLVPVFASLRFPDELVKFATQEKVYMLAYREWEYMDLLNYAEINENA